MRWFGIYQDLITTDSVVQEIFKNSRDGEVRALRQEKDRVVCAQDVRVEIKEQESTVPCPSSLLMPSKSRKEVRPHPKSN
jgi:hypothetical protein